MTTIEHTKIGMVADEVSKHATVAYWDQSEGSRTYHHRRMVEEFKQLSELMKPLVDAHDSNANECEYCGATEEETELRKHHDTQGYIPQDYICEDCFTPQDDGPCFDDLTPA